MPGSGPPGDARTAQGTGSLASQPLDPEYRRFLSLTDGLDGFHYTMPLLGCRDWENPERSGLGSMFRNIVLETGPLTEAGLPEETHVFPIHVNAEGSAGILMLHHSTMPWNASGGLVRETACSSTRSAILSPTPRMVPTVRDTSPTDLLILRVAAQYRPDSTNRCSGCVVD